MLKRYDVVIYIIIIILYTIGCDKNTNITNSEILDISMNVNVLYMPVDYNSTGVVPPSAWINGITYSGTIPEFYFYIVNEDTIFNDLQPYNGGFLDFDFNLGSYSFGNTYYSDHYNNIHINHSDYETINIEIATSIGKLRGTVSIPEMPGGVIVSENDSLLNNDILEINWICENVDWFRVKIRYSYYDNPMNSLYIDTLLTTKKLMVNGTFFSKEGHISSIDIFSYNGATPILGCEGNVEDGKGYITYRALKHTGCNIHVEGSE